MKNPAVQFIENTLAHPDGDPAFAGKPVKLMSWQSDIVQKIWPADGKRKAERVLILGPKKCGKSSFAAWLILTCLKKEPPPVRCAVTAPTLIQAENIYSLIQSAARNSGLSFKTGGKASPVISFTDRNKIFLYSGKEKSKQGGLFSFVLIDEAAEMDTESSHFQDLNAFASNPLTILLSNPPSRRGSYIEPYIRQRETKRFIKFVKQTPLSLDWRKESTWRRANPALKPAGPVPLKVYRDRVKLIKNKPAAINEFRRLFCSQMTWSGGGAWFLPELIRPVPKGKSFKDSYFHIGIDLSRSHDMTAISAACKEDNQVYLKCWAFMPRAAAEKYTDRHAKRARFFYESGEIFLTQGTTVDIEKDVMPFIEKLKNKYEISPTVAVDRVKHQLFSDKGGLVFKAFSNALTNFSAPCTLFEKRALAGELYSNSQLLKFAIGNARMTDGDVYNVPRKTKAADSIDPLISSIMAVTLAEQAPDYEPMIFNV